MAATLQHDHPAIGPTRYANTISGAFADIIAASPGASELIAVVNQQLAGSGWKIVAVKRN